VGKRRGTGEQGIKKKGLICDLVLVLFEDIVESG
jgi:hypothetical protein